MKHCNRSKLAENPRAGLGGDRTPADGGQSASPPARSIRASSGRTIMLAAGLIVLAATVAYSNSLQCAFVFDDNGNIVNNTSIRHLWPIWDVSS